MEDFDSWPENLIEKEKKTNGLVSLWIYRIKFGSFPFKKTVYYMLETLHPVRFTQPTFKPCSIRRGL